VEKRLGTSPKRIEALEVVVRHPGGLEEAKAKRLERAAGLCVVHRSLSPGVRVDVKFVPG